MNRAGYLFDVLPFVYAKKQQQQIDNNQNHNNDKNAHKSTFAFHLPI